MLKKRISKPLIWVVAIFLSSNVFAQNQTVNICPGSSIQLTATNTGHAYKWSPTSGLNATDIKNPIANPTSTTTYTVTSYVTEANNLVVNGDFENGNTNFTSEYTYYQRGTLTGQLEQGLYSVTSAGEKAKAYNTTGFGECGDRLAPSTGRMLIADGASGNNGVPPQAVVWKQNITIQPNTDYIFSAWMTNVAGGASSSLRFTINGATIGTPPSTLSQACTWGQFYVTWNSGSATTAEIAIAEQTGGGGGNDFALDDITFYKITEKTETIQVTVNASTAPTVTGSNSVCLGNTLQLSSPISGGTWSISNASIATIDATSGLVTPVSGGQANVFYHATGGCGAGTSAPFLITVNAQSAIPLISGPNSANVSNTIQLNSSATGGAWTSSDINVATIDAAGKVTGVSAGKANITYTVTGTCGNVSSAPHEVTVDVPLIAIDDAASTEINTPIQITVLLNDIAGSSPINVSTIKIGTNPSNGNLSVATNGIITYTPTNGFYGTDSFTYQVQDNNGNWSGFATVSITVNATLFIPNVITPNGDGVNDYFEIGGSKNYDKIELTIQNRWGNEVFKSNNYRNNWDGYSLNAGTYFYQLVLEKNGNRDSRKGWVLIKK